MSQFSDLNLHPVLLAAVEKMGYTTATPVQQKVIPIAMGGQDVMVSSQTGSGKTAAFLLPVLHQIILNDAIAQENPERVPKRQGRGRRNYSKPKPQAIVMCPTRELAQQVAKEAIFLKGNHRNIRIATVVGGMPYGRQIRELQNVSVLVATPGRLIDLYKQKELSFEDVRYFIADEADRMLDMGFSEDLERLHRSCENNEQTLMFSATFPAKVMRLAEQMMDHPVRIEISPKDTINKNIEQILHWADGREHQKKMLMHWLENAEIDQAVVFTSTQRETEEIADELIEAGQSADSLHGGMQQRQRNRCLDNLRRGRTKILVATDVAARGIDVEAITHVFNYGVPRQAEDYVHRIGRTGRAGREGIAVTFINYRDKRLLDAIENFTQTELIASEIEGLEPNKRPERGAPKGRGRRKGGGRGRGNSGSSNRRRESASRRDRSDRASNDDAPRRNRDERGGRRFEARDEREKRQSEGMPRRDRNERFERSPRGERPARGESGQERRVRGERRASGNGNNSGRRRNESRGSNGARGEGRPNRSERHARSF